MGDIDFEKMNSKRRALYECMWRNLKPDFPVEKTMYQGKPSNNSYTFKGAYETGSKKCRETLMKIFEIKDKELFDEKFGLSISGSGQELKRIATIHSSSLCTLLFFYSVSEEHPLELNIGGIDYVFHYSHFEYQNIVIEGRQPSNMDVVLVGIEKNSCEKVVFFLESKFSEYYDRPGKKMEIAKEYLQDTCPIGQRIYRSEWFKDVISGLDEHADDSKFVIYFDKSCYLEGIKQMISHYIGVVNRWKTPGEKDEIAKAIKNGAKVLLGEILFTDRIGDLLLSKEVTYFSSYSEKYQQLAAGLNKDILRNGMQGKISVLPELLSYDLFKKLDFITDEKVKEFYFNMG